MRRVIVCWLAALFMLSTAESSRAEFPGDYSEENPYRPAGEEASLAR